MRWQQLDFIVGIEIHLSNNHTCLDRKGKPKPFYDICDELKGKYPKDFKFTGWHPHCRCIATTIFKTEEEMAADDEAILNGEQPSDPAESDNAVKELPDNFNKWVEDNEERIARAKSLPYFIRDNVEVMMREAEKVIPIDIRGQNMALSMVDVLGNATLSREEDSLIKNEIASLIQKIDLFRKGCPVSVNALPKGTLMEWADGTLSISTVRYKLSDGREYCPATCLLNAFRKLESRQTLDFLEEYSIEGLFHENVHSKATRIFSIISGSIDEKIAETCTQLYARDRYVKIMRHFGVDAVNFELIQTDGLAYQSGCNLLRGFFTQNGELQVGELINIANETESGLRIMRKKMTALGMSEDEIDMFLQRLFK